MLWLFMMYTACNSVRLAQLYLLACYTCHVVTVIVSVCLCVCVCVCVYVTLCVVCRAGVSTRTVCISALKHLTQCHVD